MNNHEACIHDKSSPYYYDVVFFDKPYSSYLYQYHSELLLNTCVKVPFGNTERIGVIWKKSIPQSASYTIKNISVTTSETLFSQDFRNFLEFAAQYYHAPIQAVLQVAVPIANRRANFSELQLNKDFIEYVDEKYENLPPLTEEQKAVAHRLCSQEKKFSKVFIEGITGSGKTRCYLEAIRLWRQHGNVLYLVPEIFLSHQVIHFLEKFFAEDVWVIHSQVTSSYRLRLNAALKRRSRGLIVVGARSAIFTPVVNLTCVVIDEEHDPAYKQTEGVFRYHARDLAIFLAHQHQCLCILGSATPSLKFCRQDQLDVERFFLKNRATGYQLPEIEKIFVPSPTIEEPLSYEILKQIQTTLARGQQVLIYLNQRGYIPRYWCKDCRNFMHCSSCHNSYLIYHKESHVFICHHCGKSSKIKPTCTQCQKSMIPIGFGTERLFEFLSEVFPKIPQYILDTDHIKTKNQAKTAFAEISAGGACIIVGTQMISKGHDWPFVTLVVLLLSAYQLKSQLTPHIAQNVIQTAGRCGRHLPGRILLPILQGEKFDQRIHALCRNDYREFIAGYAAFLEKKYLTKMFFQTKKLENLLKELRLTFLERQIIFPWEGPFIDFPAKKGDFWQVYFLLKNISRSERQTRLTSIIEIIENDRSLKKSFLSVEIDPLVIEQSPGLFNENALD